MMVTADLTKIGGRKCAFCKHWFDPTCSAIESVRPSIGLWHYDKVIKNAKRKYYLQIRDL